MKSTNLSLRLPKYTYLNHPDFLPAYYYAKNLEEVWQQLILFGLIKPFTVTQGFKHGKYTYTDTYYNNYRINIVIKDWNWLMERQQYYLENFNFPFFKDTFLTKMATPFAKKYHKKNSYNIGATHD